MAFLSSSSTDLASRETLKDLPASSISTKMLTECTSQQQQPLSSLQIGLPTEGAASRQPSTAENMPISPSALQIPFNGRLTVSSLSRGYQLAENLTESPSIAEDPPKIPADKDISKIIRFPLAANVTLYDSNCVDLRDTPPIEIKKVNLQFSPSPPPAVPLPQFYPDSSLEPAESGSRHEKSKVASKWTPSLLRSWVHQLLWRSTSQLLRPNRPSQGDGVLVSFMCNGRNPDIVTRAALEPLASDAEKHSVAKWGFMLVARLLKRISLKMGLAGWRKGMKMEYKIEDKAEKGFEEGFEELTEEDMNVFIEHGFEDEIELGVEHDVGKRLKKVINEYMWKESTKFSRVVLRKELRKGLKKELRRLLRKELRKVLKKELGRLLRKEVEKEARQEARKEARKITLRG